MDPVRVGAEMGRGIATAVAVAVAVAVVCCLLWLWLRLFCGCDSIGGAVISVIVQPLVSCRAIRLAALLGESVDSSCCTNNVCLCLSPSLARVFVVCQFQSRSTPMAGNPKFLGLKWDRSLGNQLLLAPSPHLTTSSRETKKYKLQYVPTYLLYS